MINFFHSEKRDAYLKKLGTIKLEVNNISLKVIGSGLKSISIILTENTIVMVSPQLAILDMQAFCLIRN